MVEKKLTDGTIYKKARFLRTTCKYCGKELTKDLINNNYKWCNKKCKKKFVIRTNKKRKGGGYPYLPTMEEDYIYP